MRKTLIFICTLIASIGVLSQQAFAQSGGVGSGGVGGGDGIECAGSFVLADQNENTNDMFPDAYFSILAPDYWIFSNNPDEIIRLLLDVLAIRKPDPAQKISELLFDSEKGNAALQFEYVDELAELEDDGIVLPFFDKLIGCKKKQIAIQDLSTGRVRVLKSESDKLSLLGSALLKIHEAFIYLYKKDQEDTTEIRQKVVEIFSTPEFNNDLIYFKLKARPDRHRAHVWEVEKRRFMALGLRDDPELKLFWPIMRTSKKSEIVFERYHQLGFPPLSRKEFKSIIKRRYDLNIPNCLDDGFEEVINCWTTVLYRTRLQMGEVDE